MVGVPRRQKISQNPSPLPHGNDTIALDVPKHIFAAAGPTNLQIDCPLLAKTEVKPAVVNGIEAGLRQYLLRLQLPSISGDDAGPDRAAVALHSDQLYLDPVIPASHVVSQQ